jgi:hypothetical protein
MIFSLPFEENWQEQFRSQGWEAGSRAKKPR